MKDIYLPNLLRVENYKGINNLKSEIPYFLDFNLDSDKEFKVLVSYQLSNILEKVVIFDRVYLDLIELPFFINELAKTDLNSTQYLLEKGLLSYIDIKDLRITTKEDNKEVYTKNTLKICKYYLVSYGYQISVPKTLDEFEKYINSFIKDENIIKKIKPYLSNVFDSRKKTKCIINEKKIVQELDKSLRLGTFSKLGIGGNNFYFITKNNRSIYNLICRFFRDNYISEKIGVYTYYFDDTIEEISNLVNNKSFIFDKEFFSISDINKIPDLRVMLMSGDISIKDIIKIIKSKNIINFRKWFFNTIDSGKEVEKEFVSLLKNKESIPIKMARFLIPNIIGSVPIYGTFIGITLGALDTFFVDKILQNPTSKFIDDYSYIVNKKEKANQSIETIYIPIRKEIIIDNSLNEIELEISNISKELSRMEKDIDYSNDLEILTNYLNAGRISGKLWKYSIVLERYLHLCMCLVKKISKYSFVILKTIEDIYNIVKNEENFKFAEEYYFESYYNLVSDLAAKEQHIFNSPFIIDNNQLVKEKYNKYVINLTNDESAI